MPCLWFTSFNWKYFLKSFFFYVAVLSYPKNLTHSFCSARTCIIESMVHILDITFRTCLLVLLMDLSLMLVYWLVHLYGVYFMFKAGILQGSGAIFVIGAELWRVVLLISLHLTSGDEPDHLRLPVHRESRGGDPQAGQVSGHHRESPRKKGQYNSMTVSSYFVFCSCWSCPWGS